MKPPVIWVDEHPRIPPCLVVPLAQIERLVLGRIDPEHRFFQAPPFKQVLGDGQADPLNKPVFGARCPGLQHRPAAFMSDDAAGPGCVVVEGARRAREKRVSNGLPRDQIGRYRMADGRVPVPQVGVVMAVN